MTGKLNVPTHKIQLFENPSYYKALCLFSNFGRKEMAKKKVFISWSGDSSQKVAEVLKGWIPSVIQAIDPWVSSLDIKAGDIWSNKIKSQLDDMSFGIICLTSDNLQSDWIHFEAGALAKSMKGDSEVCPYLFQVKKSQVTGPLSQFQMVEANKEETLKLLYSLNESLGEEKLEKSNLEKTFDYLWGELELGLKKIHTEDEKKLPTRTDRDILEEILELVRGMSRSQTKDKYKSIPEESNPNDFEKLLFINAMAKDWVKADSVENLVKSYPSYKKQSKKPNADLDK